QLLRKSVVAAKARLELTHPAYGLELIRRDGPSKVDVGADWEALAATVDGFVQKLVAGAELQRLSGLRPCVARGHQAKCPRTQCKGNKTWVPHPILLTSSRPAASAR